MLSSPIRGTLSPLPAVAGSTTAVRALIEFQRPLGALRDPATDVRREPRAQLQPWQYGQPSRGSSRLVRTPPWSPRYVSSPFGWRSPVRQTMNSVTAREATTPLIDTTDGPVPWSASRLIP